MSSRPPSPSRQRLYELLADGEWHDREALILEAMPTVPPGQAYRRAESRREAAYRDEYGLGKDDPVPPRAKSADRSQIVRFGQRGIITELIGTSLKRGRFEQRVDEASGKKLIRMAIQDSDDTLEQASNDDSEAEQEQETEQPELVKVEPVKAEPEIIQVVREVFVPADDPRVPRLLEDVSTALALADQLEEDKASLQRDLNLARTALESANKQIGGMVADLTKRQESADESGRVHAEARRWKQQAERDERFLKDREFVIAQLKGTISDLLQTIVAQHERIEQIMAVMPYPTVLLKIASAVDSLSTRRWFSTAIKDASGTEFANLSAGDILRQMAIEIDRQMLTLGMPEEYQLPRALRPAKEASTT